MFGRDMIFSPNGLHMGATDEPTCANCGELRSASDGTSPGAKNPKNRRTTQPELFEK